MKTPLCTSPESQLNQTPNLAATAKPIGIVKPTFHSAFRLLLVAFTCGHLLAACANETTRPAPGSNPIFRDAFTADPAPLVVGDTLYCYVGHDQAKEGEMFNMWEWLCYSTKDMKTWTAHGPIMSVTNFKWAVRDAWAAQVVHYDEKFYLFATAQHSPPHVGKAVGVAVSDKPTGPFVDARGSALIREDSTPSPYGWDDIDPTVFVDDDGSIWMAWGNPICYLVKLKPNMVELDGPIHKVPLPNYTEGPWLYKRNGIYYLVYAAFAHQGMWEKICYATATNILGPWTYRGILTDQAKNSYTIHPGLVEFKGQWYFFYHNATLVLNGVRGALGRRSVCVEYLYYNPDGTIQPIQQTVEGVSVPPRQATGYVGHPRKPQVETSPGVTVLQTTDFYPTNWPGTPILCTVSNPFYQTPECTGFNMLGGVTNISQTFVVTNEFRLERIAIYAGDGFGTDIENPVVLWLCEIGDANAGPSKSYNAATNLLGDGKGLTVALEVQAPGIIIFEFATGNQINLKQGRTYAFELQGVRRSAPIFWRKSKRDVYPGGAACKNRSLITDRDNITCDFAMALYGRLVPMKDNRPTSQSHSTVAGEFACHESIKH